MSAKRRNVRYVASLQSDEYARCKCHPVLCEFPGDPASATGALGTQPLHAALMPASTSPVLTAAPAPAAVPAARPSPRLPPLAAVVAAPMVKPVKSPTTSSAGAYTANCSARLGGPPAPGAARGRAPDDEASSWWWWWCSAAAALGPAAAAAATQQRSASRRFRRLMAGAMTRPCGGGGCGQQQPRGNCITELQLGPSGVPRGMLASVLVSAAPAPGPSRCGDAACSCEAHCVQECARTSTKVKAPSIDGHDVDASHRQRRSLLQRQP